MAETIDVVAGAESRQRINRWVSEQTNALIPELLAVGFVTPQTVLVLTDAVDFKAQWRTIFGKYGPIDGTFTRLDGSTVDMSFMVDLEQGGPRGSGDGFVGAEVPYLGDDYSMLLVVPDEGRFAEIRERLSIGFPGIGPGVFLDGAVHGADITVDETGTEAAAATRPRFRRFRTVGTGTAGGGQPAVLLPIRHVDTGAILFAGQVTDPTA